MHCANDDPSAPASPSCAADFSSEEGFAAFEADHCERCAKLREMDHRIKNNLQLLASYTRHLARTSHESAQRQADDIAARLFMVASVHNALHNACAGEAPGLEFLRQVCASLEDGRHPILVSGDEHFAFAANELTSVGMIVTEAICNSLKHGFPDEREGDVQLKLVSRDDRRMIFISDTGVGLGPAIERRQGSGMQLMESFSRHLGGKFAVGGDFGGGVTVRLELPALAASGD